ncbi:MAG: hypothetical protein LBG89_01940 [Rickettsiales bacterium]|jgi:hypothetical protein|nr:hypothetical protein [Rickettsiales bacterium]
MAKYSTLTKFLDAYYNHSHFGKLRPEQLAKYLDLKAEKRLGKFMYKWNIVQDEPELTDEQTLQLYKDSKNFIINAREHDALETIQEPLLRGRIFNEGNELKWEDMFPQPKAPFREPKGAKNDDALMNKLIDLFYKNDEAYTNNKPYAEALTDSIYTLRSGNFDEKNLRQITIALKGLLEKDAAGNQVYDLGGLTEGQIRTLGQQIDAYRRDRFSIDPRGFEDFKKNYRKFLNDLYYTPRDSLGELATLGGKIFSRPITIVKSDDFAFKHLAFPISDELSGWKWAKENLKSFARNRITKIADKHLEHTYEMEDAREIMQMAFIYDNPPFDPKDGLPAFMKRMEEDEKAGKFGGSASQVVKSSLEILGGIQGDAPEMVAGALRSRKQARALVQEVIKRAAPSPNPVVERAAKTIMEALFVLHNGLWGTPGRKEFKELDWGLFAGLPMFQPAPLQFFAKAMDMGMNIGARAAFESAVAIRNLVMNRKFKLKAGEEWSQNARMNDWENEFLKLDAGQKARFKAALESHLPGAKFSSLPDGKSPGINDNSLYTEIKGVQELRVEFKKRDAEIKEAEDKLQKANADFINNYGVLPTAGTGSIEAAAKSAEALNAAARSDAEARKNAANAAAKDSEKARLEANRLSAELRKIDAEIQKLETRAASIGKSIAAAKGDPARAIALNASLAGIEDRLIDVRDKRLDVSREYNAARAERVAKLSAMAAASSEYVTASAELKKTSAEAGNTARIHEAAKADFDNIGALQDEIDNTKPARDKVVKKIKENMNIKGVFKNAGINLGAASPDYDAIGAKLDQIDSTITSFLGAPEITKSTSNLDETNVSLMAKQKNRMFGMIEFWNNLSDNSGAKATDARAAGMGLAPGDFKSQDWSPFRHHETEQGFYDSAKFRIERIKELQDKEAKKDALSADDTKKLSQHIEAYNRAIGREAA